jgi:hypothetical protein
MGRGCRAGHRNNIRVIGPIPFTDLHVPAKANVQSSQEETNACMWLQKSPGDASRRLQPAADKNEGVLRYLTYPSCSYNNDFCNKII